MITWDDEAFGKAMQSKPKGTPKFKVGEKVYYAGRKEEPGTVKEVKESTLGGYEYLIAYYSDWSGDIEQWYRDDANWQSKLSCNHKWKLYVGLQHRDEYCEHCGETREYTGVRRKT